MADIEKLFREYYGFVCKFLLSKCRDESLAEELTQETFFRAYINQAKLRDDAKAATWLCAIAKNLLYAHYNRQKRLVPLEDAAELHDRTDVAETVVAKTLSEEVMKHAARLDEPYREVFLLAVCGDVPLKEISRTCGKSESWARVTLHRAKQKILEEMQV